MSEERLGRMGIRLPASPAPAGSYVPAARAGDLLYVSGQIPVRDGKIMFAGKVSDANIADAQESARLCAINILSQIKAELGSLDRVARIVRLSGFVNAEAGFTSHATVINAASDMLFDVFGDIGRHARIAVGVASLPLGSMTEIDAIVQFKD